MVRVHIRITGRVQGVFFRRFVSDKAHQHHIYGQVWNTSDNAVEATLEGEATDIDHLIELCKQGPPASCVENVDIKKKEIIQNYLFDSFKILH